MTELVRDLRVASRTLTRQPTFFAAALVTLGLGIGASTAIFSVANATLLRPLPFREPGRLMLVYLAPPNLENARLGARDIPWSYPKFRALRRMNDVYEDIAAYAPDSFTLTGQGAAERLEAEYVSSNYFHVLGVEPRLGRTFTVSEDATPGAQRVAIIGESLWKRRFNAEASIAGRSVKLDDHSFTIVGVMPASFAGLSGKSEVWVPTMTYPADVLSEPMSHWLDAIARVKPGVTVDQAQARTASMGEAIDREIPDSFGAGHWGARAVPLDVVRVPAAARRAIAVLLAGVLFLLLVGCANLANLQLARGASRARETAVRLALGASRLQIARQVAVESLLVALFGGAIGLVFAEVGLRLIQTASLAMGADGRNRLIGFSTRLFEGVGLDPASFGFTLLASLASGLLFGLLPAWQSARMNLVDPLKSGGAVIGGGVRLGARSLLVSAQLALAVVLLASAGLMTRSLARLQSINPGFSAERVATMRVDLPPWRYRGPARAQILERVLERVRTLPGVVAAGVNNCTPLSDACNGTVIWFEDRPAASSAVRQPAIGVHFADGGYFSALQIPLVRGRLFGADDRAEAPRVVVVNRAAAEAFWPAREAIGRKIRVGQGGFTPPGTWAEVVGVVEDVRYGALEKPAGPEVYVPVMQAGRTSSFIFARSDRSPASITASIVSAIREIDPEIPVYGVKTMEERASGATARPKLTAVLLTVFACTALALAVVGTYGMMAFAVVQRTREIGLRMALGASRTAVVRGVLAQGASLAAAGAVAGVVIALAAGRLLGSLLFDIEPGDPVTLACVTIFLVLVALAACLPVALRASRIDPLTALRSE